ncbi:MAG: hypothetical protein ABFS43_10370 [Thermodesulfobacteriota bacterium]
MLHILFVLFWLSALEASAYTDADCINCHDRDGQESILKMSVGQFNRSVHGGEVSCQECHANVVDEDHQETAGSGAVDCSACHDQFNQHGAGATEGRPKCFTCHTRHGILSPDDPQSSVHADRLQQTCRACHAVQCGETGYLVWLASIQVASHPKQDFSQVYERENCLGCHQGRAAHGETEPVDDQNCHTCHLDDDGQNKLWGVVHPEARLASQPGVFAAACTYQLVLVILVFSGIRWLVRHFSRVSKRKD